MSKLVRGQAGQVTATAVHRLDSADQQNQANML